MWTIVLLLLAGVAIGLLIAGRKKAHSISDRLMTYSVYLLLFFMGLRVGTSEEVMQNLAATGLVSLLIAMAGMAGSILFAFLIGRKLRKHEK
jgi:uncharacterized membrane protein YbjE (DUF340 family)